LINYEEAGDHFISVGEFEEKFDTIKEDDVNSSLGTVRDIFFEFHPSTKPVLWRILITHALLYTCILKLSLDRNVTSAQRMDLRHSL